MGTQQNTNPDHRLFARPAPGAGGEDWVEVVDDGGSPPSSSGRHPDADSPAPTGVDTGYAAGDAGARDVGRPRLNPYFCAAWAVVAVMLGSGLVWLVGTPAMDALYASSTVVTTREDLTMVNFQMMGPYLLPFGLAGALALLTVQAAGYRNIRRS